MALTDTMVRTAKPKEKQFKLTDEKGMYLLVGVSGGKCWRLKYRIDGKEKLLALGTYPEVSLKEARERRDAARKLIADGIDPGLQKKAQKEARVAEVTNSFESVAREWFSRYKSAWVASHADRIIRRLEKEVFPYIGAQSVGDITPPVVLSVLRRIEDRGLLETAHRTKGNISQVMRYAIATGRADRDPCPDLRGALPPSKEKHMAAITDPQEVGELLRAIDEVNCSIVAKAALKLAPLVFVRPGELRQAKWSDIDLEAAEWRYLVSKTHTEHLVPLSKQAITVLKDIHLMTGHQEYVFPSATHKGRPMSEPVINNALKRMGYDTKEQMTGHGFRAMARTLLAEKLGQRTEVIEHQLAHKVPDALGAAYNRTKFIDERRKMMQLWADYLDQLKTQ